MLVANPARSVVRVRSRLQLLTFKTNDYERVFENYGKGHHEGEVHHKRVHHLWNYLPVGVIHYYVYCRMAGELGTMKLINIIGLVILLVVSLWAWSDTNK